MDNQSSQSWTISVGGRSYGPYSATQMRTFVSEGRLAKHSLVAPAGQNNFKPASEDAYLASLFRPIKPAEPEPVRATAQVHGLKREQAPAERTQFVIIADMKSGSLAALEEEIFNLGPTYPVLPQVWIISSETSVNAIRNALVQKLGKLDTLFVVDATHNKAAWFNFGPEADARIRKIWSKDKAAEMQRRAS
jgi:hypothetical protein